MEFQGLYLYFYFKLKNFLIFSQDMKIIVEFMYTGRINAVRRRFASLRVAAFNIRMKRLLDLLTRELQQYKPNLEYKANVFINFNIKKDKSLNTTNNSTENNNNSDLQFINSPEKLRDEKSSEGNILSVISNIFFNFMSKFY